MSESSDVTKAISPILLIEDEASVRAFVRTALERRGYIVVQALRARKGWSISQRGNMRASFPIFECREASTGPMCTTGSRKTGRTWLHGSF